MRAVFIDTETTGLDASRHRIIDIAAKVIDLADMSCLFSYSTMVMQPKSVMDAADPSSLAVNGFSLAMLHDPKNAAKSEAAVKADLAGLFTRFGIRRKEAFFIGQNPSFDRAFFAQLMSVAEQEAMKLPYHWLDCASMYWAARHMEAARLGKSLTEAISVSKDDIAAHYHLPPEAKPHRAQNGVDHAILCYKAIFNSSSCQSQQAL